MKRSSRMGPLWWAARVRVRARDERGDVPGWVMITVMTIVIASAILLIFQERVTGFLNETLNEYM
ncbi:MAG: hypothetical protein H0U28_02785 [Nocardioidaceae bacterium]|nr:hypothetical protein [Nocardioidaceae bacterium]